jgi:acyl-CoA thioesterase FadM
MRTTRPSTASLELGQDIYRLPDYKLILNAKVVIVGVEGQSYRLPKPIIDKIPITNNTDSGGYAF